MNKTNNIKVGISIGDLNGIGSEVIIKTFEDSRMLDFCTPVIFASAKFFTQCLKHFNRDIKFNGVHEIENVVTGKINVINVWKEHIDLDFGNESKEAGEYAIQSLKAAVEALKNDQIDTLVTAPINKASAYGDHFKFPGHTDFLAQELEGDSLMFMISDALRVGLLTDHVAIKEVSNKITPHIIKVKASLIKDSLIKDFNIRKPKIAVLGIDPHTGDNGVIGQDDDQILKPALEEMRQKGALIFGPYAADSFFGSGTYTEFDAIIAAYHDQGLIPFKTLTFGTGVNYTAGLRKVRTSPDHGTAFGIAGKGEADFTSFSNAVFASLHIFKNRTSYTELTANVLKKGRSHSN